MGRAADVYSALRKMVLPDDRVEGLTDAVRKRAASQVERDRRLIRPEAKFELLEPMAAPSRRAPEKSGT